MLISIKAIYPLLFYMAVGMILKKTGLAEEAFLKKLNQFVFRCIFPFLMFNNVYCANEGSGISIRSIIIAVLSVVLLQLILIMIVPKVISENPRRGVVVQALYRSNFVLFGGHIAENVFGAAGAQAAAVLTSVVVPYYNVSAVVILEMFCGDGEQRTKLPELLKKVITNPIILGSIAGFLVQWSGIEVPEVVMIPVTRLAQSATPLALIALGGMLHFEMVGGNLPVLVPCLILKLLVIPGVMVAAAGMLGIGGVERFMLLLLHCTSIAVSSYPMAQNMGGDGELAGELVIFATVSSVATMYFWITLFEKMGWLLI